MVSFSCEICNDVLTKKKLDPHRNQCYGANFTCIDCMVHFQGTDYRSHTSCISEAQKYQGHLYREKDNKKGKRKSNGQEMIPKSAYVEDAPEGDDMNTVAVIDVPPRAPTPPPALEAYGELPENINVFDYMVSDATPKAAAVQAPDERRMLGHSTPANGDSQYSQRSNGDGSRYQQRGWSYGSGPLEPSLQRYDSSHNLNGSHQMPPPQSAYVTPAPKEQRREKKDKKRGSTAVDGSDKKRKRNVEDLDLSSVKRPQSRDEMQVDPPQTGGRVLHSGLTGGLTRLVTGPDFYEDRIDAGPTPISPLRRSKKDKDGKEDRRSKHSSDRRQRSRSPERGERRKTHRRRSDSASSTEDRPRPSRRGHEQRRIEYHDDLQPSANNQVMAHTDRADLFMSFINKGPESERGCSINKVLKRYHRESEGRRDDEDKELWKSLRVRRNSRGEIVLFA